jgi:hypothetical protein
MYAMLITVGPHVCGLLYMGIFILSQKSRVEVDKETPRT